MAEKDHTSTIVLNHNIQSSVEIEHLIHTSNHKAILDWFSQHPNHPFARIFKGFRAIEQNWPHIAKELEKAALKDQKVVDFLVHKWLEKNGDLFERITKIAENEDIGETVFQLLMEMESDENAPTKVWCGLLIDGRESTQLAFNNGLRDALLDANSLLRIRVRFAQQTKALEQAQQQIRSLKNEADEWKQRYEQEVERRQQEHNTYEADHAQQIEIIAELGNTITDLQAEKTKIQHDLTQIQSLYEEELENSSSFQSEIAQIKQKLAETYQKSEEVRNENAQLKSNEKRLTEWGKTIETERDAEIRKRRDLQKQLEAANRDKEIQEHLKETAINQYHQLQAKMEQRGTEITKYSSLSPSQLDGAWQQSLTILSQHFSSSLAQPHRERRIVPNEEKLADWQDWQEEEEELVHTLFSSPQLEHAAYLTQVKKAQKLLLVRWYLLEWLGSTINQAVRVTDDQDRQD